MMPRIVVYFRLFASFQNEAAVYFMMTKRYIVMGICK